MMKDTDLGLEKRWQGTVLEISAQRGPDLPSDGHRGKHRPASVLQSPALSLPALSAILRLPRPGTLVERVGDSCHAISAHLAPKAEPVV